MLSDASTYCGMRSSFSVFYELYFLRLRRKKHTQRSYHAKKHLSAISRWRVTLIADKDHMIKIIVAYYLE